MLFSILILIVFVAEIIIAMAIISNLLKNDKKIKEANQLLEEVNPKIEELAKLGTKISEQLTEISPMYVKKTKSWFEDFVYSQSKNILAGFLIYLLKKEIKKALFK